jgi:hypothetical protein
LERFAARGHGEDFQQRGQQQNEARVGAIQSIGGQGDSGRPGEYFTNQLKAIDAAGAATETAAANGAGGGSLVTVASAGALRVGPLPTHGKCEG